MSPIPSHGGQRDHPFIPKTKQREVQKDHPRMGQGEKSEREMRRRDHSAAVSHIDTKEYGLIWAILSKTHPKD